MNLTEKFMAAAVGFGTTVATAAAIFTASWSIPSGGWLAVHNLDIAIAYGSLVSAPILGLVAGAVSGVASYHHMTKSKPSAP